jgi:cobalt-precorrin-7 (C5)-methyltransferase
MINIVGLGPGSREYILPKALEALESSEIIIGFARAIESIEFVRVQKETAKDLKEILSFIRLNKNKDISIVASGDPCFYGISDYVTRNISESVKVIPGISSFQYLMAKLNKSWQGSYLGSLHGREEVFIEKVRSNKISILLTDKINTPEAICSSLKEEKLSVKVYVGENLSYEDEKITIGIPEELMNIKFSDLSVVVIENDLLKG